MNKIRWRILWAICLFLSAISLTTTTQIWARISQQSTSTPAELPALQLAIKLILDESTGQQQSQARNVYLPLINR